MVRGYPEIRAGMPVMGSDVEKVGHVQEVRQRDFLLNRPRAADVVVPFEAVEKVTEEGWVVLTVPSSRLDEVSHPQQ